MIKPSFFFKDWAKPGPLIIDSIEPCLSPTADETLDTLCGHYKIFQLKKGHRYSTDDVLTAWYGTSWCPSAQTVLDLGSGIGSVGMMAAWRLQGVRVVAIEAQEVSVALAQKSVYWNQLGKRYEVRHGDFREGHCLSPHEKFDLILGSPPYFPLHTGIHSLHAQKMACRFEMRGSIVDYCQVASEHLNWGGFFTCVFPLQQQSRVELSAHQAELTIVRQRPVIFKEGEAPLLSLYAMVKTQHLPPTFRDQTWVEPPLVIRTRTGSPHAEYAALKLSIGLPPTN